MSITLQKINLLFHYMGHRIAGSSGNLELEQHELEEMVIIRTSIRVAKESAANNILFKSLPHA